MKKSIKNQILYTTIFPLIILGLVSIILFTIRFYVFTNNTVYEELNRISKHIEYGNQQQAFTIKEICNTEISFLNDDKRIFSTLDSIDVFIDSSIYSNMELNSATVYNNVYISGNTYFACYYATEKGMIEVIKPVTSTFSEFFSLMLPIFIVEIVAVSIMAILTLMYSSRISSMIIELRQFVKQIECEDFECRLSNELFTREDEIGKIGRGIVAMRNSLQDLLEIDSLTKLYNRKTGDKKLAAVIERANARKTPYCIAIGDIDFFKKVNDTYGHEAGDEVLKKIAEILKNNIQGKEYGYVARWGGEEFLIIFENCTRDHARIILEAILEEIRDTDIMYEDKIISVTMTFGIVRGSNSAESLFSIADEKLYYGKQHGRNQVVTEIK